MGRALALWTRPERVHYSVDMDALHLVEAAYAIDVDDDAWIRQLADVAAQVLNRGRGVIVNTYDVTSPGGVRIRAAASGTPDGFLEFFNRTSGELDDAYVRRAYLNGVPCALTSDFPGFNELPFVKSGEIGRWGVADDLILRGWEPSGHGVTVNIFKRKRAPLRAATREHLSRISGHLSAALRLRRRLRARPFEDRSREAVLDRGGRLHHAEGAAAHPAQRQQLVDAVKAMVEARGGMREREPRRALLRWKALVSARWSLIDEFQTGDRRYIVACTNAPDISEPASLSERERQVATFAAAGHTNWKLIAYELGIAHATVRVLISRAMGKLGVRTRAELVATATVWLQSSTFKLRETADRRCAMTSVVLRIKEAASECFANEVLALRVECARRFVQDEDSRIFQHGTRDRDALPLASREQAFAASSAGAAARPSGGLLRARDEDLPVVLPGPEDGFDGGESGAMRPAAGASSPVGAHGAVRVEEAARLRREAARGGDADLREYGAAVLQHAHDHGGRGQRPERCRGRRAEDELRF